MQVAEAGAVRLAVLMVDLSKTEFEEEQAVTQQGQTARRAAQYRDRVAELVAALLNVSPSTKSQDEEDRLARAAAAGAHARR